MKNIISIGFLTVVLILGFTACVKKDFDTPPLAIDVDPDLPVTSTIKELKQTYITNGSDPITQDQTVYGIVTANDATGNFYKQIIIQDSTGAIAVSINKSGLSGEFPIGRKVYLKCKGLALFDYNDFIQIGYATTPGNIDPIPSALVDEHVVKASYPHVVAPIKLSISDLNAVTTNEDMVGMLIKIDSVEFVGSHSGINWAESPDLGSGTDLEIEDCGGDKIIVRTSNYASFAASKTPIGRGSFTAIYSRYRTTAQLVVRDLNDVDMDGDRCGANSALATLSSIRALYQGASTNAPLETKIKVFVTSDVNKGNVSDRNLFVEDATGGIAIRLASGNSNTSFLMGDEIEINISGQEISEYNGLMQLNNVDIGRITEVSSLNSLTPRVATVAEILANHSTWESTFVKIENASITGGTSFSGTLTVTDATGSIDMYTSFSAAFANDAVPAGNVDVKAIISDFNGPQIVIRRSSDVN